MISVGFLGCAHVHADHYLTELSDPALDAQVVAVFDRDAEKGRKFALEAELTFVATPDDLCAIVDAAIIAGEHVYYPELVASAATAGVPVLCEKPLGISAAAAAAILGSGAWLSVAFPVRYAHPVGEAKAMIESGHLGRLLAMSGVNRADFPGRFFGTKAMAGGGAIIDHVVHLVDALSWLTGCEYDTVYAESSDLFKVRDVEDAARVIITTRDGAWVSIDPSWSRPPGMAGANDFVMTLWFEHGEMMIDAFARHGTRIETGGRLSHVPYGVGMNAAMLADWLRAIRSGAPPPIPARDGWRATELALAALASAKSGDVIKLGATTGGVQS